MLKADTTILLVILLLSDGTWEKPVSYFFAVAGAIAFLSGLDIEQKRWSRRGNLIRGLFTFSAIVLYFLTYRGEDFSMFSYKVNSAVGLFFVVVFAEILMKLIFKKGLKIAEDKIENLDK